MRVISRARLRNFWRARGHDAALAETALKAWEKTIKGASWSNWGDLRQTFNSADKVGNCIVFDIAHNKFRLIARVMFPKRIVYILAVMDHAQYDKAQWVDSCGCHRPPPKR